MYTLKGKEKTILRRQYLAVLFLILLLVNTLAFLPIPLASSDSGGTLFTEFSYPYPTDDSWVELASPDRNHGRDWKIYVKTDSATVRRSYLKFDLGVIPADKMIVSAKLYLYCVKASPTYNIQVDVHRTEDNWNEHDITWNNAPPVGAFVSSNTTVDGKYKFYFWDITSYAQCEYDGDKILSVVVKLPIDDPTHPELNPNYYRCFTTKEYWKSTKRPFLEIEYTEPQESPVADFTYSPSCPSINETVTFNASASYDPDGYITSYRWDFGDENVTTVNDPIITHIYTVGNSTINYTVTLTVTDNEGFTNSITDTVTVTNPSILHVSLPAGEDRTGISDPDPWLSECWFLNITGASGMFTVMIEDVSKCISSYDTHLVIALNDAAYNNLVSLSVNGTSIGKSDFKYGTLRPYNLRNWSSGDVYPTWFNDTLVNVGTIAKKGHVDVTVSVTFSDATGARMHFDAYGSKYPCPPTKWWQKCYITYNPISEDSTVLFWLPPPPPLSVSISPTSVVMDVGQSVTFTSSVSGGTPPYMYQWYLDDAPVPSATNPTWAFTPTSSGSYEVYVNVTDSASATAKSNIASVIVNPSLTVSISPTSVVMDVGQSQLFTSTVSDGTPPYSYQWYLNDVAVPGATASTWPFTPTSSGSYEVYVNVTDNIGATAKSNIAFVTVNPELSVGINPISAAMNLDDSKTFTSSVSGGTPPYTYQWYLNGAPVSGATSSEWTFTPTVTGSYTVYLNVTDSVGVTAQSNLASVIVNPPLEVSISPISVVMDVGQSVTFTSSVSGGTPPFTYQWYLDDTPVPGATDPTWAFTPTSPGTYEVYLVVTDSSDPAESNHVTVTVNPPPTVSINPPSVVMDVGQSQLFTSTVSDGTPPYTYQWYLDDTAVPGATDPTWTFTPTSQGSYTVYLNVTDSVGVTAKSNIASVTVNPELSVSIIPTSVTMDVGESQLFTSTISGGTPPFSYQWYLDGTPVPGATSSSWTFIPTSPGFYLVHLRVTDDVGVSAESDTASVTVRKHPKAAFTYQPLFPYVNEIITFDASDSTPNGGVITEYAWNFGDGNITIVTDPIDPIITHVYEAEGNYTVALMVTDSEGLSDSTSETIIVYLPLLYSMDHTAHHLDEEFLINIVVVNVTNLYSFEFKLGYNTTLLDAINVTEGPFLKSFGSTSATIEIHDSEGYVWISVTLLGPAPPAEPRSGILATIKFRVTYATVYPETVGCSLDLYDTELNDPAGQPIPHTIHDGSYEFVPSPPPPCIGPAIDVFTQRDGKGPNQPSDAFGPQEEVILYAYVSYSCEPVQNKLVVFEVKNPSGEPVVYRTATSNAEGIATSSFRIPWEGGEAESLFGEWIIFGSVEIAEQKVNDTCTFKFGWLIEILKVETVDGFGDPNNIFVKGEHMYFNVTIKNIAFTSKIATLSLVVYDECGVPIGHVVLHDWSISLGITQFFIIDLQIPKWAYVGTATTYVNAYTDIPQAEGTPYCPEKSATFMITKP